MPLVPATSTFGLGRRCQSSLQQCYLHCLRTIAVILYYWNCKWRVYVTCAGHLSPLWTHTHPFNGSLSGTTRVGQYQKGKTNLDSTEARDSAWQWHQLGHMQVCTSLQTDNPASTPLLSFLQAGCPSCLQTNSVKALKATSLDTCPRKSP